MKRTTYISLILLVIASNLFAQNNQRIKVEGIAHMKSVPEEIIVSMDLTIKDSLYQDCFNKSMKALSALKKNFKRNGIDPSLIVSKNIAVNESYEWRNNKRIKTGYTSSIALEIKNTFTQKYSEALLTSLDENNQELNYRISFAFSENQKTELRAKAIELAVIDAKQKAESIAKAAGIELKGISFINYESTTGYDKPVFLARTMEEAYMPVSKSSNFAGVNLNPKEQQIQKSIVIEWAF